MISIIRRSFSYFSKNIKYLNDTEILKHVKDNNIHKINFDMNIKKSNFSGLFGEKLFEEYLILTNQKYKKQVQIGEFRPDFVTDKKIIEIKTTITRSNKYENLIYSPFKYFNLSLKLKKDIDIVMIGYDKLLFIQSVQNNPLFFNHVENLKKHNIQYVFFSDLLKNTL